MKFVKFIGITLLLGAVGLSNSAFAATLQCAKDASAVDGKHDCTGTCDEGLKCYRVGTDGYFLPIPLPPSGFTPRFHRQYIVDPTTTCTCSDKPPLTAGVTELPMSMPTGDLSNLISVVLEKLFVKDDEFVHVSIEQCENEELGIEKQLLESSIFTKDDFPGVASAIGSTQSGKLN